MFNLKIIYKKKYTFILNGKKKKKTIGTQKYDEWAHELMNKNKGRGINTPKKIIIKLWKKQWDGKMQCHIFVGADSQ